MRMEAAVDKTAPFELGAGEDACLLLHGFTGTPWDIRPVGDVLASRGYHVRAPKLPGHGLVPEAMLSVSWRDWVAAAEDALATMSPGKSVFVGGLSMGALLGLILAAKHPQRVRALVLMAPAVRFRGPVMTFLKATRGVPWLQLVKPWVAKTATDLSDAAALAEAPIMARFPSARLQDLWRLQQETEAVLPRVRAPSLIAVARHDHVVDPDAGLALASRLTAAPPTRRLVLERSFHILPRDRDATVLFEAILAFFAAQPPAPLR
jgi:carboxylesterase